MFEISRYVLNKNTQVTLQKLWFFKIQGVLKCIGSIFPWFPFSVHLEEINWFIKSSHAIKKQAVVSDMIEAFTEREHMVNTLSLGMVSNIEYV